MRLSRWWIAAVGAVAMVLAALAGAGPATAATPTRPTDHIWSVQLPWTEGGHAWSQETLSALHEDGITHVEVNLSWSAIEPSRGSFDFALLDADIANAHAAGLKLIPIFWQAVWPGSPAPWISHFEVASTGKQAVIPSWWDPAARAAYFDYVTTTVRHVRGEPGFGGAFLDYGWLDAMWGQPPGYTGITGYAPADIARFHTWLPEQYGTLAAFNNKYGTDFTEWADVPAAKPGDPLFGVYDAFRLFSVRATYGALTKAVRAETSAPLFYYWGGDLSHAIQYGNVPDIFFGLAKKYHATVVLDDAESTGLIVTFASLARAYGVPLLSEWTPAGDRAGLSAEAAQWLGHSPIATPYIAGVDFFLYQGGLEYDVGFPAFLRWKRLFERAGGTYPTAPVALYVRFAPAYADNPTSPDNPFDIDFSFARTSAITGAVQAAWQRSRVPFAVVTDAEIAAGIDSLSHYRAVLPVDGTDANLAHYRGRVLTSPDQLDQYARPVAALTPNEPIVDVVPTVDRAHRTAWITVAEHSPLWNYHGTVRLRPTDLGLPQGRYHLTDLATGDPVPAQVTSDGLCVPLSATGGDLTVWKLSPGPGTASARCPTTPPTGPAVATATAGAPRGDLAFLALGATQHGSDGNLRLVTQGGVPAVATWTTAESGAFSGANMYLQLNPANPVYPRHQLRVDVTYWATPGQGFTVQYGGARGGYEQSAPVLSPGSGGWVTAHVALPDAAFSEGQNLDADLRLAVTDPTQPLTVRRITVRAG